MFYVHMRLGTSRRQVVMMRYDAAISSQDPHSIMEGDAAVCCDLLQHLSKRVQQALLQLHVCESNVNGKILVHR
jgi:hypothetical protein